jgi:hypothetical protein
MSKNWTTLSPEETGEFLRSKGRLRRGGHSMTKRLMHWPVCAACGLVGLKNKATKKAMKVCVTYE